MKILVTGHSGLLGNTLVKKLIKQKHKVYGVSRTDRMGLGKNSFQVDLANLSEPSATEYVFKTVKPDVVYHLAACASEARGQISPIDMTRRNLLMSSNVLTHSINAGVKKFIFASSISVYGDAPTPYHEDMMPRPKDVYGVNKWAFEQELKIMSKVYGFDYTILRPHNLYGPGQNMADGSKNVIGFFMRRLLENKPYVLYGEGKMRRAFTYVDDVADIFAQSLTKYSKNTLNVGSTNDITIKQLSDILQLMTGIKVPVEMKPARMQEMEHFVANHAMQDANISYTHTALVEGLQKTWDWVKSEPLPELIKMEDEICLNQ